MIGGQGQQQNQYKQIQMNQQNQNQKSSSSNHPQIQKQPLKKVQFTITTNNPQFSQSLKQNMCDESQVKQQSSRVYVKELNKQLSAYQNEQQFECQQEQVESTPNGTISQQKTKPNNKRQRLPPLLSQLNKLNATTSQTSQNQQSNPVIKQKKARYYISDFKPYLPSILDDLHRKHHKGIIRIGQKYQAQVPKQPHYEKVHKELKYQKIWSGSQQNFSQEAYKKFKQLYGQNRTQQELILLRIRLNLQNWNDLINQMINQKKLGKDGTLIINTENSTGHMTRNK